MLQITAGNVSNLCGEYNLSWLRPATAGIGDLRTILTVILSYLIIGNYEEAKKHEIRFIEFHALISVWSG